VFVTLKAVQEYSSRKRNCHVLQLAGVNSSVSTHPHLFSLTSCFTSISKQQHTGSVTCQPIDASLVQFPYLAEMQNIFACQARCLFFKRV
jgi:hypothetical protein